MLCSSTSALYAGKYMARFDLRTAFKFSVIAIFACFTCWTRAEDAAVAPRIVDGTPQPVSAFPAVGVIEDDTHSFTCTGTLIDPTHVLTAGHCATDEATGKPVADGAGRFTIGGTTYKTARIFVHPSYSGAVVGSDNVFDVAVFQLERAVPNVTPVPINRTPPTVGQTVTLVGFGLVGSGKSGTLKKVPPPGIVYKGTNTIQTITNSELIWTFTQGTSSNAPGDSGGPAFVDVNGTMAIAGITSLGETIGGNKIRFGAKNFDTRIDTLAPWIDRILTGTSLDVPPTFVSPITINPNPATVGDSVQFTAAATDPDDASIFYLWNFGDGTASTGSTVAHNYVFPGTYAVSVTASDIVTGVTSNANVVVLPQSTGTISVDKLQIGVSFSASNKDSVSLQATLQPLSSLTALPAVGVLSIGGAQIQFMLDQRGQAKIPLGILKFNLLKGTFTANLRNTNLSSQLGSTGIINTTVTNAKVTVPIGLILNGVAFQADKSLLYSAKADKSGKAK